MRPLCPIEEIVQMDQISSRLTHRHPTHGVGGLLSLSVRVSEFIFQLNLFIPPERQVALRITAQLARPGTSASWLHALVDKADRAQRTRKSMDRFGLNTPWVAYLVLNIT